MLGSYRVALKKGEYPDNEIIDQNELALLEAVFNVEVKRFENSLEREVQYAISNVSKVLTRLVIKSNDRVIEGKKALVHKCGSFYPAMEGQLSVFSKKLIDLKEVYDILKYIFSRPDGEGVKFEEIKNSSRFENQYVKLLLPHGVYMDFDLYHNVIDGDTYERINIKNTIKFINNLFEAYNNNIDNLTTNPTMTQATTQIQINNETILNWRQLNNGLRRITRYLILSVDNYVIGEKQVHPIGNEGYHSDDDEEHDYPSDSEAGDYEESHIDVFNNLGLLETEVSDLIDL